MRALAILSLSLSLLTACGQAGDLYLPDQQPGDQTQAPPPPPPGTPEDANKKGQK
jgi:predicted small lipoprotein YifL